MILKESHTTNKIVINHSTNLISNVETEIGVERKFHTSEKQQMHRIMQQILLWLTSTQCLVVVVSEKGR